MSSSALTSLARHSNQVAEVALPEVRNLLTMIWANRSLKDDFRSLMRRVQESSEYAALQKRLADWDVVVDGEVASMCAALKDMDRKEVQPEYIWKENRIGYKIHDSVDADVSFWLYNRIPLPPACRIEHIARQRVGFREGIATSDTLRKVVLCKVWFPQDPGCVRNCA